MAAFDPDTQPPRSIEDSPPNRTCDFTHDPDDQELAQFAHPDGLAAWLRAVETPWQIRVVPGTIPLWFVAICVLPIMVIAAWFWSREFARGLDDPLKLVGFVIQCGAIPAMFLVVIILNRHFLSFGPFCIVDLETSMLELPRLQLSIHKSRIVRFVEFRGWLGYRDRKRARELSVIVRNDDGSFSQCQVAIGDGWPVTRLGQRLAQFYEVEYRVVKG